MKAGGKDNGGPLVDKGVPLPPPPIGTSNDDCWVWPPDCRLSNTSVALPNENGTGGGTLGVLHKNLAVPGNFSPTTLDLQHPNRYCPSSGCSDVRSSIDKNSISASGSEGSTLTQTPGSGWSLSMIQLRYHITLRILKFL